MQRWCSALVLLLAVAAGCSRTISKEQYIEGMAAVGCAGLFETAPEAARVLKRLDLSLRDVERFRQKASPREMGQIAQEIAARVRSCSGLGAEEQAVPPGAP